MDTDLNLGTGRRSTRVAAALVALCLAAIAGLATSRAADAALVHSFDTYVGGGTLSSPEALTVDQTTGDLYVIEHGSGCVSRYFGDRGGPEDLQPHVFPASGTNQICGFLFQFADYDGYPVANSRVGIDNSGTTTEGNFYVNSPGLQSEDPGVTLGFDKDGNLETELKEQGAPDSDWPCGVAVDGVGNVYVSERYEGLQKYTHDDPVTDADFAGTVGGTGPDCSFLFDLDEQLQTFPLAGTIDRPTGDRYFTRGPYSSDGPFIKATASDGTFIEEVGQSEITDTHGVAIDESNGTLYVSDTPNGRIAVYKGTTAYRLGVDFGGTGLGAISADAAPIDACGDEGECVGYYLPSTVVLTATPQLHSVVDGWVGCNDVNPAGDECTVEITTANREVFATFTRLQETVSAATAGTGSGTVSSSDPLGAIQGCGGEGGVCSGPYDEGSAVELVATATGHSSFTGWSGACTNDAGPCEVVAEDAPSVTAHFTAEHPVSVRKSGTGAGSITSDPAGLDCGGVCVGYFTDGETVTLTAIPAGHSIFTGWSGEGCSGTGTCQVSVGDGTRSVTATFVHDTPAAATNPGASYVGQRVATVAGSVDPNGSPVTGCVVEYGTSVSYGATLPCSPSAVGSGDSPVPVGADLSGLAPGTTYHFRFSAIGIGGRSDGSDQIFRTLDDTCDSNDALCPPRRSIARGATPKCKKGFVLKRGKCVKKKHRRKARRHHRKGNRG